MADNTRKTSNIIHTVDGIKSDLNNLSQNIENNTESIGNIKVYDSHIWLSTSKGLTVTQDGNTTTNNDQPTEWKLEADTNYLNTTLNFAKSDEIPSVYVKDIKSGDITTLTVAEEDGVYTLTAMGGGGGGGIDNITLAEGTCIKIDSEPYDDNGTTKTRLTINTDTDCLNTTLNFAKPTDIGDGNITLKSTDNTVSITGANATANQATDTAWDLSVNIPTPPTPITPGDGAINLTGGTGIDVTGANGTANQTSDSNQTISIDSTVALKSDIPTIPAPVVPGDGNITLTEGDGITVSGADATANQTSDTAWTVKTDNDYLNKTLNFAKPGDIPTDLGVLTIESITPHADGDFDFVSSDDALVVNPTAHGLSLSIDEGELDFVKEIKSGNELTLTVDEVDGIVTLTAAGGGGGGAGDIAFAGGKCIDVVPDLNATTNVTTYTINNDLDCLNSSLDFATDQDITDAIGNIAIPEKTSDLVNDGEGTDPFITAADIPAVPDAALPISSTDGTVVLDSPSANTFTVETGNASIELGANLTVSTNDLERVKVDSAGRLGVTKTGTALGFMYGIVDARSNSPKTLQEQMASSGSLLDSNSSTYSIRNEAKADGTYGAFVFRVTNSKNTNQMAGFAVEAVAEGNAPDMVWVVKENAGRSKINMKLDSNGNFILPNGIVRTSEISGLADSDASIELGANLTATVGSGNTVQINSPGSAYGRLHTVRNHSAAGDVVRPSLQVLPSTGQYAVRSSLFDYVNADLTSTDPDNPFRLYDYSSTAISGKCDFVGGFVVGGYDPDFMQATQAVGAFINVAQPNDGREWYAILCEGNAPSYFGGDIQTSRIVGATTPDTDASIELGADCQILVGATQSYGLRVRSDGNVAVGGSGGGTSRFAVQGEVDGATAYGINNIPAFGAGVTTSAVCYSANPSYAADSIDSTFLFSNAKLGPTNSKVKRLTGFQLDTTNGVLATEENRAFFTNIPAGVGGQTNYAFFASGTATSYFAGGVQAPSVSGTVDNDASIELGANFSVVTGGNYALQVLNNKQVQVVAAGTIELPAICFGFLNTGFSFASGSDGKNDSPDAGLVFSAPNSSVSSTVNEIIRLRRDKQIVAADDYTPTQPNSITTRQFVLDQAGAAGLVPLGTPSDDTTPDSPNGSTLHDDLYLYVKGSTSWKKTALYPLDSSGGGSEFPLPQPGEDSGIAWETESVNLAFSQPGYGACGAAVGVAGNAFFAGNAWSVDGSQWFRVKWNGTTSGSYGVCDATSRTPAYGNGLYTGRYGYSYDGQSWTTYPNGAVGAETRECFFFQNKHYSMGGSRFFDGQLKANTNPNILGNIKNSAFVVPSNEGPSQTCLAINYSPPSGTNSLTLTDEAKRNVLLKFSGDMSTTGTWSQLQVEGSAIQTCYGLAHNDLDDKYCFITNNTSYVQKTAGNFTSSGWTKTTLPTTGEWAGLVHDGTHYVAVGIASGANISIYSEDGIAWSQSTTLSNPGVNTIAGFNGRVLAAGNLTSSDLAQILVTGNPTVTFTTKNIPLDHPVDVADSYMAQQYQMKETQADANELFTEEIQRRSPVLTLTQAEYDAISADEIEDDTLYLITS